MLKSEIIYETTDRLENKRIRGYLKSETIKESVTYFYSIVLVENNISKMNLQKSERAKELWSKVRSKFKLLTSMKRCDPLSEIKINQMKSISNFRFLSIFDQSVEKEMVNGYYLNSLNKKMECLYPVRKRNEIKLLSHKKQLMYFD